MFTFISQLAMVQTELARLSMLELDKKQEQNKNDIVIVHLNLDKMEVL